MARPVSEYVCNNCGHVTTKWSGKCEACGQWNTISEMAGSAAPPIGRGAKKTKGKSVELAPLAGNDKEPERRKSGIGEFDRVLGGGLVPGSATLIGGDPGIGKSTLLLQAAAAVGKSGGKVIYVSGEEALAQLRMRASRLGLSDANVELAAETNVADIIKTLEKLGDIALVVIDS
ncbi:MAG: DNA repair protein RadA, partial [Rhodobiaceae bacterium]